MRRLSCVLFALACLTSPSWAAYVVDSGGQVRPTINLGVGTHLVRPTADGANVLRVQTSGSAEVLGVATDTPMVRAASLTIGTGGNLYLGAGSVRANGTQHVLSQDAGTNLIHLGSTAIANGLSFDSSSGAGRFTVGTGGNGYFAGTLTVGGILYAGSGTVALTDAGGHIVSTALPSIAHSSLTGLTTGDPHTQYLLADGTRALTANWGTNGYRITGLGDPVNAGDAATKAYVDSRNTWYPSVLDKDLSAPPGSPATGARYIVWATGTGAWAGHDYDLAEYGGATWTFTDPAVGAAVWVADEAKTYVYAGAVSGWVAQNSVGNHADLSGLTTGDPHTQYAYLAGRAGGQTWTAGTAAGDDLTLNTTTNGTKGSYILPDLGATAGFVRSSAAGVLSVAAAVDLATQTTGTLAVASGGTGGATAADARTNLGLGNVTNVAQVALTAETPAASQTGGAWVTGRVKAGTLEATTGSIYLPVGQALRAGANWLIGQANDGANTNNLGSAAISNPLAIYTNTGAAKVTVDASGVVAIPSIASGVVKSASGTLSGGAAASDLSGWPAAVSMTELGYVDGVTSGIQAQLNAKESVPAGGDWTSYLRGDRTWQPFTAGVRGLVSATAPLAYDGATGTFSVSVGTSAGTVAAGDHAHDSRYSLLGHVHSSLAASDGSPDPALSVDATGNVSVVAGQLYIPQGNGLRSSSGVRLLAEVLNSTTPETHLGSISAASGAVYIDSPGHAGALAVGTDGAVSLSSLTAGGVVGAAGTTGKLSIVAATADLTSAISLKHAAATLGTTHPGLSLVGQVLSSQYATDAQDGVLSAADHGVLTTVAGTSHSHTNKALLDTYAQTEANLASAVSLKHAAVTLGATHPGLTLAGQALSSAYATGAVDGVLSAADWTTFNSKAAGTHTHADYLVKASNLSDLANVTTARTNLGLGGAALLNVGTAAGTVAAGDHAHAAYLAKASNLSDLANIPTARTNLGLGAASVLNVGTTVNTVAAGDDSRFHSAVTAGTGIGLSGQQVSVSYGTAAGTAAQGNDSRFHDAVTLGTTSGGLTLTGQEINTVFAGHGVVKGMLSGTDWDTFSAKEPGLGNPASDGMVLSSTAAGVRSWVAQGTIPGLTSGRIPYATSSGTLADSPLLNLGGGTGIETTETIYAHHHSGSGCAIAVSDWSNYGIEVSSSQTSTGCLGLTQSNPGGTLIWGSSSGGLIVMNGPTGGFSVSGAGSVTASGTGFFGGEIRSNAGFNVNGTSGWTGTIPAGKAINVSGGMITGYVP